MKISLDEYISMGAVNRIVSSKNRKIIGSEIEKIMDRFFLKECIEKEVFWPYSNEGNVNLLLKIWCKCFRPESNACYLARKYLYYSHQRTGISKAVSKLYEIVLIRRYNIWIHPDADIDIGLRIIHPSCIFITNSKIGKNFTVLHSTTVGVKEIGKFQREKCPLIGNNVTMYAGSSIIGQVNIADNTVISAHACVTKDTEAGGVYMGIPARKRERE